MSTVMNGSGALETMFDPISLDAAMGAGKKIAPDAIGFLIQSHREAMGYFDAYEDMPDAKSKMMLARRLCMALKVHMMVEEEIFYPAAQEATGDKATIGHSVEEHAEAKNLIAEIETHATGNSVVDELMEDLRQAIEDHVKTEEEELFPEVRESGADLYGVGQLLATAWVQHFSELTGKPLPASS